MPTIIKNANLCDAIGYNNSIIISNKVFIKGVVSINKMFRDKGRGVVWMYSKKLQTIGKYEKSMWE